MDQQEPQISAKTAPILDSSHELSKSTFKNTVIYQAVWIHSQLHAAEEELYQRMCLNAYARDDLGRAVAGIKSLRIREQLLRDEMRHVASIASKLHDDTQVGAPEVGVVAPVKKPA